MSAANEKQLAVNVPTDFSDYSHYTLYEGYDDADDKGIPVYQSMSTGMLFAEDATPLIYFQGRLLDLVKTARGLIKITGSSDKLEQSLCEAMDRKKQFSRILDVEHRN